MRTQLQLTAACLLLCAASAWSAPEDVKVTPTGLKYEVLTAGEAGTAPAPGDTVEVHYVGTLTNGKKFDSSRDRGRPFSFEVGMGKVIAGWDEMLPLMTVGSKVKATIPPQLGYGSQGAGADIPPDSTLIFEIELLKVTKGEPLPVFTKGEPAKVKTTASGLKWEELAAGTGAAPTADQAVSLKWALWTTGGKLLVCSRTLGGPLTGPVSKLQLGPVKIKFLQEAPLLLAPGGRYRFEVPPALGWGDKALGDLLPANSTTIWELQLVSVTDLPKFTNLDPAKTKTTASGLKYEVLREGTGKAPRATDEVTVNYAGWLTDGTQFDSSYSRGEPTSFPLNGVIKGWTEGLQLMKEGGLVRFSIPGKLAYGENPPPNAPIPPNATLIFLVELLKVGN